MGCGYPEFSGGAKEEVLNFLEEMEVACINNHIVDPAHVLRLLQISIKGDARKWLYSFEAQLARAEPAVPITVEMITEGLKQCYRNVEDGDKIWQEVKSLKQREEETVECFEK